MWVGVGIAVAGIAGAGIGAMASSNAADKAAGATKYASDTASQAQWDMYDTTRNDFSRFLTPSDKALATLQSAIYGGSFGSPSQGYTEINTGDLASLNSPDGHRLNRSEVAKYDTNKTWYKGPNGEIVDTIPTESNVFKPQESEAYKAVKGQTLADLGRYYRSLGRGNSTAAMNATGRTLTGLNYQNEEDQKNQLWNLVKTGQGAAGSIAGAGQNAANQVSNAAINSGNNLSNIALQNGQTQASLYGGIGGTLANAYGTYQMGKYINNQNKPVV